MRTIATLLFCLCLSSCIHAAPADDDTPPSRNPTAPVEDRVTDLLSRLTLEEKADLCHGAFVSGGIPRLGVGKLLMLDGRQGLRPVDKLKNTRCREPAYPVNVPDRSEGARACSRGPAKPEPSSLPFRGAAASWSAKVRFCFEAPGLTQSLYWGIFMRSPPLRADWCAMMPETVMLSAWAMSTSGFRF